MDQYSRTGFPFVTSDVVSDDEHSDAESEVDELDFADSFAFDPSYEAPTRATKPSPPPLQKAEVEDLAEDHSPVKVDSKAEKRVLEVIMKCRARADHPATPQPEAEVALRTACRLMVQHHITEGEIFAEVMNPVVRNLVGGESTVRIVSTKGDSRKVIQETWVLFVSRAITTFVDCKSYTTLKPSALVWIFYGIAENTRAAAIAFEMVHNLVIEWARGKKRAKNSYCLGIANGLCQIAKDEKKQAKQEAKKREKEITSARLNQEARDRQHELNRLHGLHQNEHEKVDSKMGGSDGGTSSRDLATPPAEIPFRERHHHQPSVEDAVEDLPNSTLEHGKRNSNISETEGDYQYNDQDHTSEVDPDQELEHLLATFKPAKTISVPPYQLEVGDDAVEAEKSLCASLQQLVLYEDKAGKIADDFLKSKKIKLGPARKRKWDIRDRIAYEDGKKDSEDIDIKRRRIDIGLEQRF